MNMQKDLQYFMKLNYTVILKKTNNFYYLFIPELSLIAEGESLKETYEKLEKEKESYFRRAIEMNVEDSIKEPTSISLRKKISIDLFMFFTKTAIISLIIAILLVGTLPIFGSLINSSINAIPGQTKSLVLKFSDKLSNMPQDKKDEIMLKLRKIVQEIKPFTDEVKVLFEDKSNKKLETNKNLP